MIKTINKYSSINTLLIGDLILDRFVFGHSSRISREAPVLVLKYRSEKVVPGGGGNAANNLLKLNCKLKIAIIYLIKRRGNLSSDKSISCQNCNSFLPQVL